MKLLKKITSSDFAKIITVTVWIIGMIVMIYKSISE
jgi:hypothetical protein